MADKDDDSFDQIEDSTPINARVPLRLLLPILAVVGLTSLGGGRLALYYDAFVQKRGWLTSQFFLESLTVSQVLPGPTFANLTVFLSQRLGGGWGALAGFVLVLVPGAVTMVVLTHFYQLGTTQLPAIDNAFRGVGVAASGMTLITVWRLIRARSGVPDRASLALAAITFVALGPLQLSMYLVVPPLAAVALWIYRPRAGQAAND